METNTGPHTFRIGYISACIAHDHRYTSKIEVLVEGTKAHVVLSENTATGGMDGPGGADPFRETKRSTVAAKAGDIVKAIKATVDDTIKRYGTPSKSFNWIGVTERGLSVARCQQALDRLKED